MWKFSVIWFTYFSRLLNNLKAGSVKRINKLPGAIAGLVSFSLSCLSCNILTACSFFTYLKKTLSLTLSLVNNKDACNTCHILLWFHEVWATSILTLTLRVWHLDYQLVYYVLCRLIALTSVVMHMDIMHVSWCIIYWLLFASGPTPRAMYIVTTDWLSCPPKQSLCMMDIKK